MTLYRKRGVTVRYEHRQHVRPALVAVTESGEFCEQTQRARSSAAATDEIDAEMERLRRITLERAAAVQQSDELEQLTITAGLAQHEYGDRAWSEKTSQTIAVVLDRQRSRRFVVHTGGDLLHSGFEGALQELRGALALPDTLGTSRASVAVSGQAAAELVRQLARLYSSTREAAAGASYSQVAPPFSQFDGMGMTIPQSALSPDDLARPRTLYRPSYRYAPVRHLLHLRLDLPFSSVRSECRLIAFSSAPVIRRASVTFEGLFSNGEAASVASVALTSVDLRSLKREEGREQEWFPHDGGTWSGGLLLPEIALDYVRSN